MKQSKAITTRLNQLAGVTEPEGRNVFKKRYKQLHELVYGDEVYNKTFNHHGVIVIENDPVKKQIVGEFLGERVTLNYIDLQSITKQ